ncbi:hypothetical protein NLJ89_g7875 [Agrocybe chaxingu]|uniref:Enhancer of polycomb-like N-terminal domain-containing protein n=1 Tax=Agrocybe chaxingu TaxID=84603 RepID=A0A9W8JYE7_9AGAR|nr:hypothetical protein NLJ89_g7875 [Agrocybe chaxingu]
MSFFARRAGRVDAIVIACICVQLGFQMMIYMAFASLQILLVQSIPEGGPMGMLNGVAQMLSSGTRSIAPTFASSLFSVSLQRQLLGGNLVYLVLISLVLAGIQAAQFLSNPPEKKENRRSQQSTATFFSGGDLEGEEYDDPSGMEDYREPETPCSRGSVNIYSLRITSNDEVDRPAPLKAQLASATLLRAPTPSKGHNDKDVTLSSRKMARGHHHHHHHAASPAASALPKVEFEIAKDDVMKLPAGVHEAAPRAYGYNDFSEFRRPDHYIRHIEPLESDLAKLVEYDMDEQDQEWLEAVNADRKKDQMDKVSLEVFEIMMDRLEKEWFDLTKNIPKQDFAMPSEDSTCAVCDDSEGENSNAIVFCDGCNLAVHQGALVSSSSPAPSYSTRPTSSTSSPTPTHNTLECYRRTLKGICDGLYELFGFLEIAQFGSYDFFMKAMVLARNKWSER